MIKYFLKLVFLLFLSVKIYSQGKFVLIGGGSEKDTENSWNHQAYKWAVDQSANKKVAIIAFGTADDWLPNYFKNSCGATDAINFNISNSTTANLQSTYDDLMACDVIFLKGGDQYNYYSTYRGTKTQQAIEDKFTEGGVICGTSAGLAILSEVLFTAQNGSAYSDESIMDPNNSYIKLANDFLPFFNGFIFDTHFTIRARAGRLLAFMANWDFNYNEQLIGVGVDEMTAMCVDENKIGTAYGIGTVNIYKSKSENTFSQNNTKLLADSVQLIQLLQGCSIDLNTFEVSGFTASRNPIANQEKGNYTIYASGSDVITYNQNLLNDFVNASGSESDKILIVTGSNQTVANSFKTKLLNLGASDVFIHSATLDMANDQDFANAISTSKKILFINNDYSDLIFFLNAGTTGDLLNNKIRENNAITAFIGDNSRYIGHTVVEKYLNTDAAYYGELSYNKGLNLLKTTVIIPNTYFSSDYFENISAAVPYAMVKDTLTYGIWLNKNNYIKYAPNSENNTYIYSSGTSPVMILKSEGTNVGFSVQTAYGDGVNDPPHFAGFENMTLSLVDESTPYKLGDEVEVTTSVISFKNEEIQVYVDHKLNQIIINWDNKDFRVDVYDLSGKPVKKEICYDEGVISSSNLNSGIYIVSLVSGNNVYSEKILLLNN